MYRLIYSDSESGYQEESGVFMSEANAVRFGLEVGDLDAKVIYLGTDEVIGTVRECADALELEVE